MLKGMNFFTRNGELVKLTPTEAEDIRKEIDDAWEYPSKCEDRDAVEDLNFILTYLNTKEYEEKMHTPKMVVQGG